LKYLSVVYNEIFLCRYIRVFVLGHNVAAILYISIPIKGPLLTKVKIPTAASCGAFGIFTLEIGYR